MPSFLEAETRPNLERARKSSSKKERIPAAESAKVQHLARGLNALGIEDDEARYLASRRPKEVSAVTQEKNGPKRVSLMNRLLGKKGTEEKEVLL